ncbi:hypothetical protein N0V90_002354 [Kalmusia sp. IMI 367209]|nr:hypothetical protein N0V90_002354 [Kalmusia sp. IMI 367209]
MSNDTTSQLHLIAKGGPFGFASASKPTPASDQLLIRVQATALNSLDLKQRDTGLFISRYPHVLGIEGAGVVETVGSDVKGFQPGDEIMACLAGNARGLGWGGSYAEHVTVPEKFFVARKPKNISIVEAASLPIAYMTAVCGILDGLKIPLPFLPGTPDSGTVPASVLVLGGSSATGASLIQLLRLAYPSLPIYATSSPRNFDRVKSLGATAVFDYHSAFIVADIRDQTPNAQGVDAIVDFVAAGAGQTDICDVLDARGANLYATVVNSVDVPVPNGVTRRLFDGWALLEMPGGETVLPALTGLVERSKFKASVGVRVAGHGLKKVPEAMEEVPKVSGEKIVVTL